MSSKITLYQSNFKRLLVKHSNNTGQEGFKRIWELYQLEKFQIRKRRKEIATTKLYSRILLPVPVAVHQNYRITYAIHVGYMEDGTFYAKGTNQSKPITLPHLSQTGKGSVALSLFLFQAA